jgi:hypothetical protein
MFRTHQTTDNPSLWGQHAFLCKSSSSLAQANRLVSHSDYTPPAEIILVLQCHCNILEACSWDGCVFYPLLYPLVWHLFHLDGINPVPLLVQHLETWKINRKHFNNMETCRRDGRLFRTPLSCLQDWHFLHQIRKYPGHLHEHDLHIWTTVTETWNLIRSLTFIANFYQNKLLIYENQ